MGFFVGLLLSGKLHLRDTTGDSTALSVVVKLWI